MGKIVKYCSTCEEGFAEKFSFCPNCANELSAFEMKPVDGASSVIQEPIAETTKDYQVVSNFEEKTAADSIISEETNVEETPEFVEEQAVFEPLSFSDESTNGFDTSAEIDSDDILELNVEEPSKTENVVEPVAETVKFQEDDFVIEKDEPTYESNYDFNDGDGSGYHVTVVSEKGGSVRNGLLLAAFALITFAFAGLMLYSLFYNLDDVASLNSEEQLLAYLDENPMPLEEKEVKKDDKKGGGGGGGGRENEKPASRGELPSQQKTLPPPPQVLPRLPDPVLPQVNRTQGNNKRERTDRTGINGLSDVASSGRGRGGGIGEGNGTGAGNGFGTGEGNGRGSGSGNGDGDGDGDGTGSGRGRDRRVADSGPPPPPPPPPPSGPTTGIQILSKPKPGYTDAARQNNVTGVVRVRVAFMANGSIGGVSVVSGLPHGLTEKAIAAARQIRFKPPLKNGVPQSVNKVVVFNFNIY